NNTKYTGRYFAITFPDFPDADIVRLLCSRPRHRAIFVRYTKGTTNIHTRSTKCQYSPVVSTCPGVKLPLEYLRATTASATTPMSTCSKCNPVMLKKACPKSPELSLMPCLNRPNHSRICSPAKIRPRTMMQPWKRGHLGLSPYWEA